MEIVEGPSGSDPSAAEFWHRMGKDSEWEEVTATRSDGGQWMIFVAAAELYRGVRLESELFTGVESELDSVRGVSSVEHMDRELWAVEGDPDGRELVLAVARFVDQYISSHDVEEEFPVPDSDGNVLTGTLTKVARGWEYELTVAPGDLKLLVFDENEVGVLSLDEVQERAHDIAGAAMSARCSASWAGDGPWVVEFRRTSKRRRFRPGVFKVTLIRDSRGWEFVYEDEKGNTSWEGISPMPGESELPDLAEAKEKALEWAQGGGAITYTAQWRGSYPKWRATLRPTVSGDS